MGNTVKKTFSLPPDVFELLKLYAKETRQSASRAITMMILEKAGGRGINTNGNDKMGGLSE